MEFDQISMFFPDSFHREIIRQTFAESREFLKEAIGQEESINPCNHSGVKTAMSSDDR